MAGARQKDFQDALTAGHALAWDGFWESAADAYRRAVASAPQEPAARAYFGMALLRLGAEEEAIAELREAAKLQPSNALLARRLASLEHPAPADQAPIAVQESVGPAAARSPEPVLAASVPSESLVAPEAPEPLIATEPAAPERGAPPVETEPSLVTVELPEATAAPEPEMEALIVTPEPISVEEVPVGAASVLESAEVPTDAVANYAFIAEPTEAADFEEASQVVDEPAVAPPDEPSEREVPATAVLEPVAEATTADVPDSPRVVEPTAPEETPPKALESGVPASEPDAQPQKSKRSWWRSFVPGQAQANDATEQQEVSAVPEVGVPAAEETPMEESVPAVEPPPIVAPSSTLEPQEIAEPEPAVVEVALASAVDAPDESWRAEWRRANELLALGQVVDALAVQLAAVRLALAPNGAGEDATQLRQLPGVDEFAAAEARGLMAEEAFGVALALARGAALAERGLFATARDEYEIAIGLAPAYLPVQVALADLYERTGRHEEAKDKLSAIATVCELRGQTEMAESLRARLRVA
ncbi:MAG: tetratricopeptide repeat protein [Chloroflexota bacterium]